MKNLVQYLKESKKKTFNTTLKDFLTWYIGENEVKEITEDDLLNCSLDYLEDDLDMSLGDIADLFNKHLNDKITVYSEDLGNAISNEFNLDDITISIDSIDWFK